MLLFSGKNAPHTMIFFGQDLVPSLIHIWRGSNSQPFWLLPDFLENILFFFLINFFTC